MICILRKMLRLFLLRDKMLLSRTFCNVNFGCEHSPSTEGLFVLFLVKLSGEAAIVTTARHDRGFAAQVRSELCTNHVSTLF